ncbi:MAG: hypothetical protein AAGG79_01825 [Pseudomonadota bacterium]
MSEPMVRSIWSFVALVAAAAVLAGCISRTVPVPETTRVEAPRVVLSHAGQSVVTNQGRIKQSREERTVCPAGNALTSDQVMVTGGFPAPFDLQITNEMSFVAAEVSIAGGTLTGLTKEAVRSASARDGQTVELAKLPLTPSAEGTSHLRFSVIPITGSPRGGPETVEIYTRVLEDTGNALALPRVIAGSEARLCGPY